VIELRSKSDRLQVLQDKMQEYIDNGVLVAHIVIKTIKHSARDIPYPQTALNI
jgi:hypothetical protein